MNGLIAAAGNVCFLGFSFAEENLDLFEPTAFDNKHLVLATSLGLSQNRMAAVKKVIRKIQFFDMPISELLRQEDLFRAPRVARVNAASGMRIRKVASLFEPGERSF
jgi:hypothetical protein